MRNTNAFSEHKVGRVCPEYEFANSIKSARTLRTIKYLQGGSALGFGLGVVRSKSRGGAALNPTYRAAFFQQAQIISAECAEFFGNTTHLDNTILSR